MKMLLLEDNERLCNFVSKVLTKEGYKVDVFFDGGEAMKVLNDGYDCYILDINVPTVDGITVLKTIRENNKNSVVVVVSSNLQVQDLELISSLQKTDYLKKPFFVDELIEKIKFLTL